MKRSVKVEVLPAGITSIKPETGHETALAIASLVDKFGGYSFPFEAPDGSVILVSLEHLRHRDPESNFVTVTVVAEAEGQMEGEWLRERLDAQD